MDGHVQKILFKKLFFGEIVWDSPFFKIFTWKATQLPTTITVGRLE
jgi:hypothetical protein